MKNRFVMKLAHFTLGVAVFAFGVASCLAADPNFVPNHFKASIQTFKRPTYAVELIDGVLIYSEARSSTNAVQSRIAPTIEQWREFRDAVDKINVWQWQSRFDHSDVFDGTRWSLIIEYSDHSLRTRGNNGYPKSDGNLSDELAQTKTFKEYLAAVQKLLGGKAFK